MTQAPDADASRLPVTMTYTESLGLADEAFVIDETENFAATGSANADSIGTPIDPATLATLRGGESTVDNEVIIDGSVGGNTADHVVSGSNAISDGAFSNANGINTVIQNTGSNVLIQNGMVVNVQFVAPGP
jgi:hypothetical protein